jgi:CO dehydrogenase maturation factor
MDKKTQIIAVAGKGGVGKTSLAGVIVKLLVEAHPDKKILAIDADPAVGLSTVLNVEVDKTIDDIRKEVIKNVEDGDTKTAVELLGEAKYEIMDAVVEQDGYAFIAIGRPETAGCYCKINSYLKEVITMLSDKFDYVVIDGEAGIEQINRRVMEKVTHLLLVTDASKKGCQVVQTIKKVADELGKYYPENFGYAYPEKREHFGSSYRCYVVTADENKVTKGNFNFSIYAMMARGFGSFKGISSLEERKLSIDTWIEASARTYFAAEGKDIEYISDCFEVIQ